jgi:hypothetical protein
VQEVGLKESGLDRVRGPDYENSEWRIRPLDLRRWAAGHRRGAVSVHSTLKQHPKFSMPTCHRRLLQYGTSGTACQIPQGGLSAHLGVPLHHRSRRAPEDAQASASESMQDVSALASLDLAGVDSLRSICSSIALTDLLADFRVRRPASVSSAWRMRWCCG